MLRMIYFKAAGMGLAMFVLAFVLFFAISLGYARHRLSNNMAKITARTQESAGAGFDMHSEWIDIKATDGLIAGGVAFAGGAYWSVRRSRRKQR